MSQSQLHRLDRCCKTLVLVVAVCAIFSAPGFLHAADPFTIVALPDTQNYSSGYPAGFLAQTQWIADNKATENIAFVTHLGDIVNNTSSTQWDNAVAAMTVLDTAAMPYGVVRGNHDTGGSYYLDNFGPTTSRFQGKPWYGGASPSGFSNYQKINAGGRDFLMLGIDIAITTAEVTWAQTVIDANPGIPTILTTHSYLAALGDDGQYGSGTGERGRVATAAYGSDYSPTELFDTLIAPNDEIFMVLSGHNILQYNLVATNDAGNDVHEITLDYQDLPDGGNGFLRLMEFDLDNNVIHSTTYSPTLNRNMVAADTAGDVSAPLNDPDGHAFDITLDFDARYGPIPEPATMSMLALGGLALLRRKRRNK